MGSALVGVVLLDVRALGDSALVGAETVCEERERGGGEGETSKVGVVDRHISLACVRGQACGIASRGDNGTPGQPSPAGNAARAASQPARPAPRQHTAANVPLLAVLVDLLVRGAAAGLCTAVPAPLALSIARRHAAERRPPLEGVV